MKPGDDTKPGTRLQPQYLILGEVLRPHGIRGELRLRLLTDYPERIAGLQYVYLGRSVDDPRIKQYVVQHMRRNDPYGLLKLEGVHDRNDAEMLRALFVMVRLEDAVPLADDEVYLFQLIGLTVRTTDGYEIGTITEILETGANDVYIINSPQHGEVLFPATPDTIIQTDMDGGVVVVSLPDGLIADQ